MEAIGRAQSWDPAAQVILGSDPKLAVYGEVVVWLHKVDLFRREEQLRMHDQFPGPEDLSLHQQLLRRLIADGDHLVRLVEHHGFLRNTDGLAADDLKATLYNLRADYRGRHEPMPEVRRAHILREVFDVPEPAD